MPEAFILPLPYNTPGTIIDPKWERQHNVPQWFGWLVNHLLAQIPMRRSTTLGQPHRDINALAAEISSRIKADGPANKTIFKTLEHKLPIWLLEEFLFLPVTDTSLRQPDTDVPHLLRQTIKLHDRQSNKKKKKNQDVPENLWKELRENLKAELILMEPDRKLKMPEPQAIAHRNSLHCLEYTLRAALCIAEEKTKTSIASCTCSAIQAYETFTQKLNDTAYLLVTGRIIEMLGGNMPIPIPKN